MGMADGPRSPELRSILTSTRVGDLTLSSWPTLGPQDTVAAAAACMRQAHHGSALVCSGGRLVGIFTERDLLRAIGAGRDLSQPLAGVMTAAPRTVTTATTLFEATQLMDEGGYRRLPVVDADGHPCGIVDVKTVTHFLVEHFPAAVYNQASHAQLLARNPEGA
jgi:CBS domain-containing protein